LIVAGLCAFAASTHASSAVGLRYLGEIGHLGTPLDQRSSVRFGPAKIISQSDQSVLIEGQDDGGKAWKVVVPTQGGIGWTTVWQADFDRNGRPDLLLAAFFPPNGRCIDSITLSFLLFNNHGQPVPWVIETRMPESKRFPAIPAIFADWNRDGGPRLVVTDCDYSKPPRFGEDRWITGIYEAKDASWSLAHPANIATYTALVRRSYRFRPSHDRLLPTDPTQWLDRGKKPNLVAPPLLDETAWSPSFWRRSPPPPPRDPATGQE